MRMRTRRGFSLLAVMIALILLGVGIMALANTRNIVTAMQGRTAARTTELAIARAYMEVLRGRDPTTLVSEAAMQVDSQGQPSASGPYTRTVEVGVVQSNLKRVTVTVQAPRAGAPVALQTLVYVPST